jgi:DNA-directed RNA polymerase subunit N (RpoN/RPB10)
VSNDRLPLDVAPDLLLPVRGDDGQQMEEFSRLIIEQQKRPKEAFAAFGSYRHCCRRMLLTHIDLIAKMFPHSRTDEPGEPTPETRNRAIPNEAVEALTFRPLPPCNLNSIFGHRRRSTPHSTVSRPESLRRVA